MIGVGFRRLPICPSEPSKMYLVEFASGRRAMYAFLELDLSPGMDMC